MYNHQNLDTVPEFNTPARRNTTVEVMAHAVFNQLMARLTKFHAETSVTDGKGVSLYFATIFWQTPRGTCVSSRRAWMAKRHVRI